MFSSGQLLELFVVVSIANQFRYAFFKVRSASAHALSKSGPVRPDSLPAHFWDLLLGALQVAASFLIPVIYAFTVTIAGLTQPAWMNVLAFPDLIFGVRLDGILKFVLRALGCVASMPIRSISERAFEHLGDQYHPIGRREKPRVVQTGPYALVRHPLYGLALLQAALQSLIFWSYAPLFALVLHVIIFAVKIPIEEAAIQRDAGMREEYREYIRKVPARVVPYVW